MDGGSREAPAIDATQPGQRANANPAAEPDWPAISGWATRLAGRIARDQPTQHVAVFVPDHASDGMRLVAQFWGAGEDTGEVVVGEWLVPMTGSVCGRVYRTGAAALCTDVSLDPDYRAFPGGRSRSSLTVPVQGPDGVVAVINVEAPWIGAFSIRDYDQLRAAAAASVGTYPARAED